MDKFDRKIINPYGDDKDFAACGIFAAMNTAGNRFGSKDVVRAMANMHDRGNGLGGGFAVYGIYPQFKDYYAFHVMYLSRDAKEKTDRILASKFDIIYDEEMQTRPANVRDPPVVWRYFATPKKLRPENQSEEDYVIEAIMRINTETGKAFVFSSGNPDDLQARRPRGEVRGDRDAQCRWALRLRRSSLGAPGGRSTGVLRGG
jgi:glutamate synthase domain-containing protein 1